MVKKFNISTPVLAGAIVALGVPSAVFAVTSLTAPVDVSGASGNVMNVAQTSKTTTGVGLHASANDGYAVMGSSLKSNGIVGLTTENNINVGGIFGLDDSFRGESNGVVGQSKNGDGVFGFSTGASGWGVEGYGNASGAGDGVLGDAIGSGVDAFGEATPNGTDAEALYVEGDGGSPLIGAYNTSFANPFEVYDNTYDTAYCPKVNPCNAAGDTVVTGDLYVYGNVSVGSASGGASQLSVRRTSSGRQVATYAAQERRAVAEDTGEAQLQAGQVRVPLDPDFAATIDAKSSYVVFITPEGDTRGMYVTGRTSQGFTVRETLGGRSNTPFAYRIVAKFLPAPAPQARAPRAHGIPRQHRALSPARLAADPRMARLLQGLPAR
jgi:hypothetical protein